VAILSGRRSVHGPALPTFGAAAVGIYLGYTGCDGSLFSEAALDPKETALRA
jgi:hypothetical protein